MAEYMPPGGPAGAGQAAAAFSVADGDSPPILDMTFDTGTLHTLRAEVQAQAHQAGFPDSRSAEMVLALHELAANAVRHGAGAGRLRIWNLAGARHCQVDDCLLACADPPGPGANHEEAAEAKGMSGLATMSSWQVMPGHGLLVVRQVADQMQILSGPHGTSATVTFDLPRRKQVMSATLDPVASSIWKVPTAGRVRRRGRSDRWRWRGLGRTPGGSCGSIAWDRRRRSEPERGRCRGRSIERSLIGILRNIGRQRLTRMGGLPGAAVTDAHVLDDMAAGPEPQAVRCFVGVHVSGDDYVPGRFCKRRSRSWSC